MINIMMPLNNHVDYYMSTDMIHYYIERPKTES